MFVVVVVVVTCMCYMWVGLCDYVFMCDRGVIGLCFLLCVLLLLMVVGIICVCLFACLRDCVFCTCVCVIMYGCRYVSLLVGGIRWHLEDIWKDADAFGSTGSI